CARVQGEFDVW
nr:immunoglobulin heavy chain junction region [Macaca mulatta]